MSFIDKNTEKQQASITYGGKEISDYGKFIIMEVLTYYAENISVSNEYETKIKSAITNLFSKTELLKDSSKISQLWNEFLKDLEVESANGALLLAYTAYHPEKNDLLFRTIYAYGKIKRLEKKEDWFDNFRLNGLAEGMNHIVWRDCDKEKTYEIGKDPEPINKEANISNSDNCVKLLVGELRRFIIENNFYQTNAEYKLVKPKPTMSKTNQEICDECYLHYPFYYGGAHGCDFYNFPNLAMSISDYDKFLQRYPSAIIGMILNTATYAGGTGGKHWVSFLMKKDRYFYINSSGRPISESLSNGPDFERRLQELGYGGSWNNQQLQTDEYSCGMFAFISMYLMLSYDCDLFRTIQKIGIDGTNLVKDFKVTIRSFTKVLAVPDSDEIIDVKRK